MIRRHNPVAVVGRNRNSNRLIWPFPLTAAMGLLAVILATPAPSLARQGGVFYVDGSRTNNGTGTQNDPFNTLNAVPAEENSEVYVAGTLREAVQWSGLRRGSVVAQWPGQPQAELRGDVVVPPLNWRFSSGGTYFASTPESPASVVWNWDQNIDVLGRHFGHMRGAASLSECRNLPATWFFDPVTSRLHVNPPPGAQPPNQGDVYAWVRTGCGFSITDGDGLTIDGLSFRLWSDPNPGNGYGLKINDGINATVQNCFFEDCGYHSAGFVGNFCQNNRFIACTGRGLHGRSNHFVFYSQTGNITGCRAESCEAHLYGILDWNGQPLDTSDRVGGYYTHTGFGAVARDLEFFRCRAIGYSGATGNAFGVGQATPTVADGRDVWAYPVRFVDCVAENCDFVNVEGSVSFIRCRFDFRRASITGGITESCLLFNRAGTQVAIQSSVFLTRLDGANASRAIWIKNSDDVLYLLGVTFYDDFPDTAVRSFIRAGELCHVTAEQCVFASAASMFLTNGASTHTPEHFEFLNCWYFGIGAEQYSSSDTINERLEWASLVDSNGWYDIDPGFTRPPLDPSPSPGGPLWRARAPLAGVSREGISGIAYDGRLGAYQYGWPIAQLISSACPGAGPIKLTWSGAKPFGTVAFLYSRRLGSDRIPAGFPCAGLQLELRDALPSGGTLRSDLTGAGEFNGTVRATVCDGFLQMVDIGSCATTNVVPID